MRPKIAYICPPVSVIKRELYFRIGPSGPGWIGLYGCDYACKYSETAIAANGIRLRQAHRGFIKMHHAKYDLVGLSSNTSKQSSLG